MQMPVETNSTTNMASSESLSQSPTTEALQNGKWPYDGEETQGDKGRRMMCMCGPDLRNPTLRETKFWFKIDPYKETIFFDFWKFSYPYGNI